MKRPESSLDSLVAFHIARWWTQLSAKKRLITGEEERAKGGHSNEIDKHWPPFACPPPEGISSVPYLQTGVW